MCRTPLNYRLKTMVSWCFLQISPSTCTNPLSFCRNVDGLHQAAGSSADLVVEVHGSTQDMDRNLDDSAGIFGNFIFDLWWIYDGFMAYHSLGFIGSSNIFHWNWGCRRCLDHLRSTLSDCDTLPTTRWFLGCRTCFQGREEELVDDFD